MSNLVYWVLQNLLRNPWNLTWICTKASWNLFRNLLRNPVEPDLPLHQSLPDLHRNLLRNPVEPDPKASQIFSRTFSGTLLNLTWLCISGTFSEPCWTWPGSAPNPPRPSPEPSPAPSAEPCWTWLGFAPRLPGAFSGNLLRNPVEPDLALHLRNLLRNLLRNPVEPDLSPHQRPSSEPSEPSPEPCWTWPGACTSAHRSYSGLKTPLAYAVGEKCYSAEWPKETTFRCRLAWTRASSAELSHFPSLSWNLKT